MRTVLGAALLFASCGVAAQAAAGAAGFYASADIGVIEPTVGASSGIVVLEPGSFPVGLVPDSTHADGSETSWSIGIGYRISRHLAGELAYLDLGPVNIVETYDLCDTICAIDPPVAFVDTASHVKGPLISVLGMLPMGERFEAFVRAGILFGAQELNLTSGPGVLQGPRVRNAVEPWVFGLGFAFSVNERWSLRLEYLAVEELPDNGITGTVRQERYSLGATWRF